MLTLPQIQESLGIKLTGNFITDALGIVPAERDKRAVLFSPDQFDAIKAALIEHVEGCEPVDAPSKAKKPAPVEDDDGL